MKERSLLSKLFEISYTIAAVFAVFEIILNIFRGLVSYDFHKKLVEFYSPSDPILYTLVSYPRFIWENWYAFYLVAVLTIALIFIGIESGENEPKWVRASIWFALVNVYYWAFILVYDIIVYYFI